MVREDPYGRLRGWGRAICIVSIYQIYAGEILTLHFKPVEGVVGPTRYFSYISIHLV